MPMFTTKQKKTSRQIKIEKQRAAGEKRRNLRKEIAKREGVNWRRVSLHSSVDAPNPKYVIKNKHGKNKICL